MADEDRRKQFWDTFRHLLAEKGTAPEEYESLYKDIVKEARDRPVSYEEFYYLLSRYAFLDIYHADGFQPIEGRTPEIIQAKSGWTILNYEDRLRSAGTKLMYGSYHEEGGEGGNDSGSGSVVSRPVGTLVQQMVDTASEMIDLAKEKGWPGAKVYSGFYGMIRAAWIVAKNRQFELSGFEPTVNDEVVRHWVEHLLPNSLEQKKSMKRGT